VAVICIVTQKEQHKKNNTMKTKKIIFGIVVAAISTLVINQARAQEQPAIKIVPAIEQNVIKVIYGYHSTKFVEVTFSNHEGVINIDRIGGETFTKGFMKKYNVEKMRGNIFWIQVQSPELSVTYKMTGAKNGKWLPQLEKTTYNHQIVALN
jgi:hypothetical protein